MDRTTHKPLVLILARELAANVATPMLIVDPDGVLVYFNEPAEAVLGQTFAGTGEVPMVDLRGTWRPERLDGTPYPTRQFPLTKAVLDRRPAHDTFRFRAGDGVTRTVTATAYPLLAADDEFAGAMAVFWEQDT